MELLMRKVSTLPAATTLEGLIVLGVDGVTNKSCKVGIELLKGNTGITPVLTVQVTALTAGSAPTVSKSGTAEAPTITIGIPRGADGTNPVFRTGSAGIEWKYSNEDDTAYRSLVSYEVLKLKYSDLTAADIAVLQQPATDKAAELETWKNGAVTELNAAKDAANETAEHPTYVGVDYYVYKWNTTTKAYINTGIYTKGDTGEDGRSVKVGENGNYWYWDNTTSAYVDSGVVAAATVDINNVNVAFNEAATKENINTGELIPTLFGKLKKWFSSFGALAWKSSVDYATEVSNTPTIPTVTNDFTNDYKSYLDFLTGYNSVTTLVSLPVTKRVVLATVSAATSLSLAATLADGKELLIKLVNSTASAITQPLPTSAPFNSTKPDGTAIGSITLPASGKVEISIIAINSVYYIKTDA